MGEFKFQYEIFRHDVDDMQKLLDKKLGEARRAHSELRLVIRENQELDQVNRRLRERVGELEQQNNQLRRGMVQIQTSLNTCLNHDHVTVSCDPCLRCNTERCDSRATSSGV